MYLKDYRRLQIVRLALLVLGIATASAISASIGTRAGVLLAFGAISAVYLVLTTFSPRARMGDATLEQIAIAGDVMVVSGLLWLVGEARTGYHLLYYIPIVNAGMRLRPRESATAALLSAGCYMIVLLAHPAGVMTAGTAFLHAVSLLAPAAVIVNAFSLLRQETEASQGLREALHDSLRRFSAVYDVAHAANAGADIGGVLTVLLEQAVQATGARQGAIALVQSDGTLCESATFGEAPAPGAGLDPSGEAAQRALRSGEPVLCDATGQAMMQSPPFSVYVPLLSPSGTIGVLAVGAETRRLHRKPVEFLKSLCSEAAIALENAQLRTDLHRMAVTDGLTNLFNRREMERRLSAEMEAARRYCRPLAVLMIDCDGLKMVNDQCGHAAGDALLCILARVLKRALRAPDSAGRMGGDEFLVILPEVEIRGAAAAARRILRLFREEAAREAETWQDLPLPGLSVGVAVADATTSPEGLLAAADAALYEAKSGGKNGLRLAGSGTATATL